MIQLFKLFLRALALVAMLTGCASVQPELAPVVAEPRHAPARNFTSFNDALRCVDTQLARKGAPRVAISSTGIPDLTYGVKVGADEMLINAVNQMNRKSRAYVFIDQPLERKDAQIFWLTKRDDDPEPRFYIRGAISQLDSSVVSDQIDVVGDDTLNPSRALRRKTIGRSRKISVVTVDLHLVSYPDRTVLPGASVANSMVVVGDGFSAGTSGLIDMTSLDFTIRINRVESLGQAVRNLVELGTIELLGRHAGVPYWQCLSHPDVKVARRGVAERAETTRPGPARVAEAQKLLISLGYLSGTASGTLDRLTRRAIARFQSDEKLLASGEVDHDLIRRLRQRAKTPELRVTAASDAANARREKPRSAPAKSPAKGQCPPGTNDTAYGCLSDQEVLAVYFKRGSNKP